MKVTFTSADGRLTFEVEGQTQIDLWREIARFQEVFDTTASALIDGKEVSSSDVKFVVRKANYKDEKGKEKEAHYYELRVVSGPLRGYRKDFGVLDDGSGGLFPRRSPEENSVKGLNGWYKYQKPN